MASGFLSFRPLGAILSQKCAVIEGVKEVQRPQPQPGPAPERSASGMRVAYLTNQYPKVSHTFIRREILAMERLGLMVQRIALRGWDGEVVDGLDRAERERTTYLLRHGLLPLLAASMRACVSAPRRFFRALGAALEMSVRAMRPLPYHLVYLGHACRLLELFHEKPVEHLHAHFGTNSAEVAMLLNILGGPTYSFTVHGADEADNGKYLHFDRKVQHAKFVTAISSYTRSQLMRHVAPADWHKIHVVHCGLDAESFAIPGVASDLPNAPRFLCIGRLSAEKGHLILLDAFHQVATRHPEASLILAGDGPLRSVLEDRIRELGLEDQVTITGWICGKTVREEIVASHVLVQPSLQEGLPVVIMEAMALCRPVISTYVAGIPELVVPGEVGWLVPAGNVETLAAAMEESAACPKEKLHRMGAAAYERAVKRHSIDVEAKKLASLFASTA